MQFYRNLEGENGSDLGVSAAAAESTPGSVQDALLRLKRAITSHGKEVIDLSMINPDIPPPRILLDKLFEASAKPDNHRYAVSRGVRKLREAFAAKYQAAFGVTLNPENEVCVTFGTKDAVNQVLACNTQPGDCLLLGSPTYPAYHHIADCLKLRVAEFVVSADLNSTFDELHKALELHQPKVLLLNFPNNPTGLLANIDFYRKVAAVTAGKGVLVLNDFVYGEMVHGQLPAESMLSNPTLRHTAVETFSLSKAYSVPGWRVGALVGCKEIVAAVAHRKSLVDYGLFLPLQIAASAGLQAKVDCSAAIRSEYERRIRFMWNALEMSGPAPASGCCLWIPVAQGNGTEFAQKLIVEDNILVLPGEVFGKAYRNFVRIALVQPIDRLSAAAEKIRDRLMAA